MKKLLAPALAFLILLSFGLSISYAQTGGGTPTNNSSGGGTPYAIKINNPFDVCGASGCGLLDFIHAVINNIIMPLVGVIIVLAFIWNGFQYVMARGNSAKISKANEMMRFTVIGAAILLAATAISDLITSTINQFQTHN